MNTSDIIQSMNLAAVSKQPIASSLLNDIAGALRERDELRAEVEETEAANDRLTTAINEIESEYQRLRAALLEIADRSGETAIRQMCHKALGTVAQ